MSLLTLNDNFQYMRKNLLFLHLNVNYVNAVCLGKNKIRVKIGCSKLIKKYLSTLTL